MTLGAIVPHRPSQRHSRSGLPEPDGKSFDGNNRKQNTPTNNTLSEFYVRSSVQHKPTCITSQQEIDKVNATFFRNSNKNKRKTDITALTNDHASPSNPSIHSDGGEIFIKLECKQPQLRDINLPRGHDWTYCLRPLAGGWLKFKRHKAVAGSTSIQTKVVAACFRRSAVVVHKISQKPQMYIHVIRRLHTKWVRFEVEKF